MMIAPSRAAMMRTPSMAKSKGRLTYATVSSDPKMVMMVATARLPAFADVRRSVIALTAAQG